MSDHQRVTLIVTGRVQGVFYRDSTMRKARELGLSGNVRNLPDGSVRIEAQGPAAALEKLVIWAHEGPPAAVVSEVRSTYEAPVQGSSGFTVEY
jgi:acylphosphatase